MDKFPPGPCLSTSSTTDGPAVETADTATSPHLGPRSPNSDEEHSSNFKKSRTPARILYYRNDSWVDFPLHVLDELIARFAGGQPVFDISVAGKLFRFDFIRMVQIDLSRNAVESSIAWIDIDNRCFFPIRFAADPEAAVSGGPRFPGARRMRAEDKNYKVVESVFLNGMRRAGLSPAVTAVHRWSFSGLSGSVRLRAFKMAAEMTKAARGVEAKEGFGWYGAAAEGVAGIVKHGFGRTNAGALGNEACGLGVHLSPANSPFTSCRLAEADESGERHIVLCRVILGKSERVEAGSAQCHSSSDEFDSAVDDPRDPRWYVIWSTHMNTHILPEYIVSFRTPSHHRRPGMQVSVNLMPKTQMIHELSFKKILSEIGRSLPSTSLLSLEIMYDKYKAGKTSRDAVIRHLRSVAGDKLLASAIRRVRGC